MIEIEGVSELPQFRAEREPCREGFRAVGPSQRSSANLTDHVGKAEREDTELVHRIFGSKSTGTQGQGLIELRQCFGLQVTKHVLEVSAQSFF